MPGKQPAPSAGPALAPHGLNIAICQKFNALKR